MSFLFQNNGESSSSRQQQPPTSQPSRQGLGVLGLGLDLTDSFSRASVDEPPSFTDTDQRDTPIMAAELATNARRVAAAEHARNTITDADLSAFGIQIMPSSFLEEPPQEASPTKASPCKHKSKPLQDQPTRHHDFFANMANYPELFMELAKHLRVHDLLSLFAISKDFHETINGHLSHCIRTCAEYMAPESSKLYLFKFYKSLCMPDPAGRGHPLRPGQQRLVPSMKWLQMIVHREKSVRDILACMARQGHRMKPGMALSLKKSKLPWPLPSFQALEKLSNANDWFGTVWLIMDISTTNARVQFMHNETQFTDLDLYNLQFFIVKLDMRFNDPIDGPGTEDLRKLFLGQKSLTPLALLLKRKAFLDCVSVVKLAVRYSYVVRPEHKHMPIFGIPPEEVGIGHLEGWGKGKCHLMRPDELVMRESVRRGLGLKAHIMEMMTWGYVDPITGMNIKVTDEEIYMSDDEGKNEDGHDSNDYWGLGEMAKEGSEEEEGEDSDEEDDDEDDNAIIDDEGNFVGIST